MAVKMQSNGSFWISEEHREQLLPGIPNAITLNEITPRLPWRAIRILSSVSRCWRGAIQSHEVYNARARAQSLETFIVHYHHYGDAEVVALYSPRDDRCYELPALRHLGKEVLRTCECIALDGKIYVMGGWNDRSTGLAEVYVLDVAGQRLWEQCASMQERRYKFGCGVLHGKIYVFGGNNFPAVGRGSEVYDPKENAWSPIMPMTSWRVKPHVTTFGDELFVYGGWVYREDFLNVFPSNSADTSNYALFCEVYNSAKNEWRLVDLAGRRQVFMANGKFYSIDGSGRYMDVLDADKISWTNRHTNWYGDIGPYDAHPLFTLAIKDELFTYAKCKIPYSSHGERRWGFLLQSKGFDGENRRLVWQKTNCYRYFREDLGTTPLKCLIQL